MPYLLDTNIVGNIMKPAPVEVAALDAIIAAVAEAHGCAVVTDDEEDFDGTRVINLLRGTL
jgi:predicted nucleic acid-binding protein